MLDMAKRRAPSKTDDSAKPKPPNRSGEPLYVYLPPDVADALGRFLADTRPKTSKTAVTEEALREYFVARGYLPSDPPATPDAD
jgi:hypothetical protein